MRVLLLCALILLIGALPAAGATYIVDDDTGSTVDENGDPATRDFDTIDEALRTATSDGDLVFVNNGTYDVNSRITVATDWRANNVEIRGQSEAGVIWQATTAAGYVILAPTTRSGCKISNLTIEATVATARGINLTGNVTGFTLEDVTIDIDGYNILFQSMTSTTGLVFRRVTFSPTVNGINTAFRLLGKQTGTLIEQCVFDFSAVLGYAGATWLDIEGSENAIIQDCTFIGGPSQNAAVGIRFKGDGTNTTVGPTIRRNTFLISENENGSWRTLIFGDNAADDVTSGAMIYSNTFSLPTATPAAGTGHYAIEFENVVAGAYNAGNSVFGNRIFGGGDTDTKGILFAEGSIWNRAFGNEITNIGTAFAIQDARYNTISGNRILGGCAVGFEISKNGGLAYNSYGNTFSGNFLERPTYGIFHQDDGTGTVYVLHDSLTTIDGNFGSPTNWATWGASPGDNNYTLAQYVAAEGPPDAGWSHGASSVDFSVTSDSAAALRATKALGSSVNVLGAQGKGLIK